MKNCIQRNIRGNAVLVTVLCVLFLVLGATGGWLAAQRLILSDATQRCAAGPWGELHYLDSFIEAPKSLINATSVPHERTLWFVAAVSPLNLKLTLRSCELNELQVSNLLATAVTDGKGDGYILQPSDEFVIDLKSDERSKLYGFLASFTQNVMYAEPYRFEANTSREWLENSHLEPKVVDLVQKLIYREGGLWLFSDLNLVLRHYPDPQIYAKLFRVLSREATLLAYVQVRSDDNADDLAQYWGWPDRVDAVRIRIKASQATRSTQNVSLAMLLPYFARDRLLRYHNKEDPEFASCHYSAMNFFNDPPDLRFTNATEIVRSLQLDYVEVKEDLQLGDIVQLLQKDGTVVHSCNYVADRLVFSKNGGSLVQPWVLTKLDDLVEFYSYPKSVKLRFMRRHDLIKHFKP